MLSVGTILGDRYEILEEIGSGGMADVYKAKCHKLNRFVAIKVLKSEFSQDSGFVSKFKAEAQAAAGLMHPNIVNVYDVGEEYGMYYFVMELVEGITLKKYIEKKIRLTTKEAVSIAIQVAMGIEAAHNSGIIHRDIKPQNIIISKEGKVKVADFGIAKAVSSDTITSHAMGSVHYTSPEQARGGYSDIKSDIYSIGITLFEMVTGRVPFDGETTVSVAIKHIQEDMPSPKNYVPDVPISVEQIIYKCCQKNPDRRYASVGLLIKDLKYSLSNPDEEFVVINDAASNEGTKTITDSDKAEIRQKSMVSGPVYDEILPGRGTGPINPDYRMNQTGPVREVGTYRTGTGPMREVAGRGTGPIRGEAGRSMEGSSNASVKPAKQPQRQSQAADDYEDDVRIAARGKNTYEDSYSKGNYEDSYTKNRYDEDDDYDLEYERRKQPARNERNSSGTKNKQKAQGDSRKAGSKSGSKRSSDNRASGNRYDYDKKSANAKNYKDSRRNSYYEDDLEDDVDPKMEKVITILLVIAAIIITGVAVVFVGKIFGAFSFGNSSEDMGIPQIDIQTEASAGVTVPNLVGMSVEEAVAALDAVGLKAEASKSESTEYEANYICSQDIEGGTSVSPGTLLKIVVSSGKVTGATVPDVVGLSEAEAKVMLEAEGFAMQKQLQESASVEKGNVVSQTPLGATTAAKGSAVTVVISSGATTSQLEMPNLVGMPEEEAKVVIDESGLVLRTVSEDYSDTVGEGKIASQSVVAGAMVEGGTAVDIVVSLGMLIKTYSCRVDVNAPNNYFEGSDAIIVLMNDQGAEINRYNVTAFPYAIDEKGINSSATGAVTITYLSNDGTWETTTPLAVNFTPEG